MRAMGTARKAAVAGCLERKNLKSAWQDRVGVRLLPAINLVRNPFFPHILGPRFVRWPRRVA